VRGRRSAERAVRSKDAHPIFVAARGTLRFEISPSRMFRRASHVAFPVVRVEGPTGNAPGLFCPSNKTPCSPSHREELAFNFWIVSEEPCRRLQFQPNVNRLALPPTARNAAEFLRDSAPGGGRMRGLEARPPQDHGDRCMRWGRSHGGEFQNTDRALGGSPRRGRPSRPRNLSHLIARHEMSGVTGDQHAGRRAYSPRYTTRPPTIVPTTFPVNCQPSNGEFRDNERDFVTSNVHRFLGSKIVRSP